MRKETTKKQLEGIILEEAQCQMPKFTRKRTLLFACKNEDNIEELLDFSNH